METKMKLLGITVLYNPPEEVTDNILSYISGLDKLILWNNSVSQPLAIENREKIVYMGDGTNKGIGEALNGAARYAMENGYTHLLTMDQDSRFKDNDFPAYIKTISCANEKTVFSPNYIIHNKEWYAARNSFIEVERTMTSGTVYPVCLFSEIGLFRADFFIDAIDVEYGLRARQNGIPAKIIPFAYLLHGAGYQKKKHKFLWKTFFPNEYSPVRSYYTVRNGLVTKKLYPWSNWKGFLFYYFYKRIFFVLMYEDNKYKKLKGLTLGYIHGKTGKTGKQKIFKETEPV